MKETGSSASESDREREKSRRSTWLWHLLFCSTHPSVAKNNHLLGDFSTTLCRGAREKENAVAAIMAIYFTAALQLSVICESQF